MTKLQWSETHQDIGELFMDVVGPDGWTTRATGSSAGPRAVPATGERSVVPFRDDLGRLLAGAAQHRRRARARPAAIAAAQKEDEQWSSRSPTSSARCRTPCGPTCATVSDLAAVRGVYDDPEGNGNPDELWKALAEQGWLAVLDPRGARRARPRPARRGRDRPLPGCRRGARPRTPRPCWPPKRSGWPAAVRSRRRGCRGSRPERYDWRSRCVARAATGRSPALRSRPTATS